MRVLPDGEARPATLLGRKGNTVWLDMRDREAALGAALEIEAGSMLYWGEVRERNGSCYWVKLENSLDRAALASEREHWG